MKRFRSVLWLSLVALVAVGLATQARAYPEPSIVTRAWEFDFSHETPRLIPVEGLEGETQWYWYMTYKVVNRTGQDRVFIPEITIATDEGDIFPANVGVPVSVFDAVKAELDNPLLESPIQIVGPLREGEDYAKEGVAIWPVLDRDVDQLSIFFAGLSGETEVIPHPVTGQRVVMRKTLMINYFLPGSPPEPEDLVIEPSGERWIMR